MLLFEALGEPAPRYGHLPLILGPDRAKLSKRHGAVAVEWFREHGYLPEALVNYLALLGWSPGHNEEILPRDELIKRFDLDGVSHHPAIFDVEKLTWMNGQYIRSLPDEELAARLPQVLADEGVTADVETIRAAAPFVKERIKTLTEAAGMLRFAFVDDVRPDEKAAKEIAKAGAGYLAEVADRVESVQPWAIEAIEATLTELQESTGLSKSRAWAPVRAAITGTSVAPPLFQSIWLIGRDRAVRRLRAAATAPSG
jgi:glutamyl/glutaminyl-tRNA synthetase